jgi:hypothetical protein
MGTPTGPQLTPGSCRHATCRALDAAPSVFCLCFDSSSSTAAQHPHHDPGGQASLHLSSASVFLSGPLPMTCVHDVTADPTLSRATQLHLGHLNTACTILEVMSSSHPTLRRLFDRAGAYWGDYAPVGPLDNHLHWLHRKLPRVMLAASHRPTACHLTASYNRLLRR